MCYLAHSIDVIEPKVRVNESRKRKPIEKLNLGEIVTYEKLNG